LILRNIFYQLGKRQSAAPSRLTAVVKSNNGKFVPRREWEAEQKRLAEIEAAKRMPNSLNEPYDTSQRMPASQGETYDTSQRIPGKDIFDFTQ
jgi:hypothetical protein